MKRFFVAIGVALAALALAAPASATRVVVDITCTEATFSYTSFPEGRESSAVETVTVNGTQVHSGTFVFTGPSDTHVVSLSITGSATVVATSVWTTPFNTGQGGGEADVDCGGGTTGGDTGTTGTSDTGGTTGTSDTGGTTGTSDTGTGGVISGTTGGSGETSGELPFTGLPIWIPIVLAGALLVSGAFLLRRKRDDVS